MPRAGHDTFSNDTLVERAAAMRAGFIENEEFSTVSKDGEALSLDIDDDSLSLGDISNRGDANFGHWNQEAKAFFRPARTAPTVSSRSCSVWAVETKRASNWEGAR